MNKVYKKSINEKQSLGMEAIYFVIAKVLTQTLILLTTMVMSRYFTLSEYGTYSQIILVINLTAILLMLGIPNSMNYFIGKSTSEEDNKEFLSVYYTLISILCIGLALILFILSPLIVKYFDNLLIYEALFFMVLYPWGKVVTSGAENLYVVYHKTKRLISYRLIYNSSLFLTIIICAILNMNFVQSLWFMLVVTAIFAIIIYFEASRLGGRLRFIISYKWIKKILGFSVPLGLASAVGTLNIELDKFIVGKFVDSATLAVYANASKELPVSIVESAFTAILLPKFARLLKDKKCKKVQELWSSAIIISFSFISYVAIGMFVFAPECIRILYSEKYMVGVPVFRVYCVVLLMRFTYYGIVLNASGKSRLIFGSAIASLVLNCILNYPLLMVMGIIGPAIATFISQIVINGVQLYFTKEYLHISLKKLFPWSTIFKLLGLNICLGIICFILKNVISLDLIFGSVIEALILVVVCGVVYLILIHSLIDKEWKKFNK